MGSCCRYISYSLNKCFILTFDRAVNQGFLYSGCTCINKLITGKQPEKKQYMGVSRSRGGNWKLVGPCEIINTQVHMSDTVSLGTMVGQSVKEDSGPRLRRTAALGWVLLVKKAEVPSGALNIESQCWLRIYGSILQSSVCLSSMCLSHVYANFRHFREINCENYIFVKVMLWSFIP